MQLVLATNNDDKITEIRHMLEDLPITVLRRNDFLDFPDPTEDGASLAANAIIKARAIGEYTGLPSLADDSGLEVDALNGAPGIYSSRYAGENVSYEDNRLKLLAAMTDIPEANRTARFRCVIAICWSLENIQTVEGIAEGRITTRQIGGGGFGYDPIFFYPPLGRTFAELSLDEKNRISHRGQALLAARTMIVERLNIGQPR